ncbi:hypothetical protein Cgig2_033636 [Carnegiea gigantea]|uniref:Uncharacterized protein n=1 Tax=Carnegiea gigantea TaxID=171969 RepID=A0A9Q1QCA2_9CARY|nr:hypothetical protein Cgig2_033636 [Carnegiea gigantea]
MQTTFLRDAYYCLPTLFTCKEGVVAPEAHLSTNLHGSSKDKRSDCSIGNLHIKEEEPFMLHSTYEIDSSLPNCKDLWDVMNEVVHPLVDKNVLCLDRQKASLDFFRTEEATSAKSMSVEAKFSRLRLIMLLRDTNHTGLLTGWSIILPLNWVKAFWISLVSSGAHVVGRISLFPVDFPNCNAYSYTMAREATEVEKKMECCTLDIRSLNIPIPPAWTSINFSFNKVARQVSGDHLLLFPKRPDRTSFLHLMKDEDKFSQASKAATLTSYSRRLSYLRVLLHAYKEVSGNFSCKQTPLQAKLIGSQ